MTLLLILSLGILIQGQATASQAEGRRPGTDQEVCVQSNETLAAYLQLLESAGRERSAEKTRSVRTMVAQMAPLVPSGILDRSLVDVKRDDLGALRDGWSLRDDTGEILARWWRSQDPVPATSKNERLEEHLCRVAYADSHFEFSQSDTGWDDRGILYVRLGHPATMHSIDFSDPRLLRILVKATTPVLRAEFPHNEVWFYEEITQSGGYLFVKHGPEYRLGEIRDLLPGSLKIISGRQNNMLLQGNPPPGKTEVLLTALAVILRELVPYHPEYAMAYLDVANVSESITLAGLETGEPLYSKPVGTSSEMIQPHLFAALKLSEAETIEETISLRRDKTVPRVREDATPVGDLPIHTRHARFLDSNGSTRSDIYWTVGNREGISYGNNNRYLFNVTGNHYDADFQLTGTTTEKVRVLAPVDAYGDEAFLPVQRFSIERKVRGSNVAIQWDHYPLIEHNGSLHRASERPVRRAVVRYDSLVTLSSDEARLELSDLLPVVMLDGIKSTGIPAEAVLVSPHQAINRKVGLYFEVYHLTFDTDDRTRFSATFEMRDEARVRPRLFRRANRRTNRVTTRYIGDSRTARELIEVDLSERRDGVEGLTVCLAIRDEVSGQEVERCTPFDASDKVVG